MSAESDSSPMSTSMQTSSANGANTQGQFQALSLFAQLISPSASFVFDFPSLHLRFKAVRDSSF